LEVEEKEDDIVEVRGFACKLGKEYAEREHTDPRRLVASTVSVEGGIWPRLPVKTADPIPKDAVVPLCRALRQICVMAPIERGAVIASNVVGTEVDIVATRDMPLATNGSWEA
jgi:CxxC motif-containing protein